MKYLIVAVFALVTPVLSRPQEAQQVHAQAGAPGGSATPVSIVSQTEVIGGDGSFNYSYETSNGIHVEQGGYVKKGAGAGASAKSLDPNNPDETGDVQVIQGQYSYTAPDGQQISLRYIADDNGFQPEGDHLPKAPPVPADIARTLEQGQQGQQQQGQIQHPQPFQQQGQQQHPQPFQQQGQQQRPQPFQQQQQQRQDFTSTSVYPAPTVTAA